MYKGVEEVHETLNRYGLDFAAHAALFPTAPKFQLAHLGEIISCAFFEECLNLEVLVYKWRLNTTRNQHQYGMDLLAFDFSETPPRIYFVAVKTTEDGGDGRVPSVVYKALEELEQYISNSNKLDDDLNVIVSNLRVKDEIKKVVQDWYNPYTQGIPEAKPNLIAVATIVAEQTRWNDNYAMPIAHKDFSVEARGVVLTFDNLDEMRATVYGV